MDQQLSLKEAERKAFQMVFQDGLWDLYLGSVMLAMGVGPTLNATMRGTALSPSLILEIVGILIGVWGLPLLLLWAGKRYITLPRLGLVEFGPAGKARKKKAQILMTVLLLMSVPLLLISIWYALNPPVPAVLTWLIPSIIWGVISVVVFSLGAYFLDFKRAYFYAWLFAAPFPLTNWLRESYALPFMTVYVIFSAVMITTGGGLFVRFIRKYPVSEMEVIHG